MKIRLRLILLVCGLMIGGMALAAWRFVDLNQTVQKENRLALVERTAAVAAALTNAHVERLRDRLYDLVSSEQAIRRQTSNIGPSEDMLHQAIANSPFYVVSLLRFEGEKWQELWTRMRPVIRARWPEAFVKSVLSDLPVDGAKAEGILWYRISDPASQPVFLTLARFQDGADPVVAIGFLPASALSGVSEAFVGSGTEVVVIDERGFAVANTEQAYVGAPLTDSNPVVAEVLKRRETATSFDSQNRAKQAVIAASQRIKDTNLYVAVSQPSRPGWSLVARLIFSIVIFAVALILLGVALGYWTILPLENAVDYLTAQILNIASGRPANYFAPGNPFLDPLKDSVDRLIAKSAGETPQFLREATADKVEQEKLGAYREMSVGLAQSLKEPLAAVLAQAQLARAKAGQDAVKDHVVVIEREARRARDTIDNLLRLTGEEQVARIRIEVRDVVLAALSGLKNLLASHNVRVVKELVASAPIMGNAAQLETALEEVIKNAVEAMGSGGDRIMKVKSYVSDQHIGLVIEDNGVGLEAANVAKVFDPFFTTKNVDSHKGLGLTVAKGIVKNMGGVMRLESAGPGQGTRVIFEFPIISAKAARSEAETSAPSGIGKMSLSQAAAISSGDLNRPLTGTIADALPTAPSLDEVTFTGIQIDPDVVVPSAELPAPPVAPGGAEISVAGSTIAEEDVDDEIVFRPPKVKESN